VRVIVTGGAGFIGANLVQALLDAGVGDEVVVVDDFSTGTRSNLVDDPRVEVHELSVLELEQLRRVCVGATTIVHLGAVPSVPRSIEDPLRSHHANATGTVHVLEAARDAGAHVIVASSSSVYGADPTLPKNESVASRPLSPYAASKLATEGYAIAYHHAFDIAVLPFRFFNVYGPLQAAGHAYAAVIPQFLDAAFADDELQIHGDGQQTRDFTFVGSVTAVLVDAVRRRVTSPDPVNLAFGTRTSLLELVAVLEQVLGRALPRQYVEPRPGDVRDSQADNAALRGLFPSLQPVPLAEGLRLTAEWFEVARAATEA
jgi:UDP-glucose 4-epimerase